MVTDAIDAAVVDIAANSVVVIAVDVAAVLVRLLVLLRPL